MTQTSAAQVFNVARRTVYSCLSIEKQTGKVMVIDNASVHQSPKVRELITKAGGELIYLPP